ncbi:hypothetical protein TNCV_3035651 [Trichonephila clavipes]|nr:hypothetical protein TNCV_3035651 [Trichonephila clavipes]
MRDQKVNAVWRITIRKDGQVLNTKHLILTFSTPDLPQYVKMVYLRCPVREYIPTIHYDASIANATDIQRTFLGISQPALVAGRRVTTVTTEAKKTLHKLQR